jgi:sarcosine oxidase
VAIYERQAGFLYPKRAVRTAAQRAEDLGARIVRRTVVNRIEPHGDHVRILADGVMCEARHAIISVGAWLQAMLPALDLPVRVTRQVVGWWPIDTSQPFVPERFPVFIRDIGHSVTADMSFYGFPTQDGQTIKVALHREGNVVNPDTIDRAVTPEDLAPARDAIRRFFNSVQPEAIRTSVCMYTNTPDHDFLIGSPPDMPSITLLGGFSGHGFKFASVIGDIGADLATRGGTDYPVAWLSPNRFIADTLPQNREQRGG